MPAILRRYVEIVDAVNYRIGRFAMYLLFALMAILIWSILCKTYFLEQDWVWALEFNSWTSTFFRGAWTQDMAQFVFVAFFFLGGPYALQMHANVRMDLFYGEWTPTRKAWVDAFTVFFLIFYLSLMLYGAFSSTGYALETGEVRRGAWRPPMAPIKIIMCAAIILMLLQSVAILIKDIAKLRGIEMPNPAERRGQVEPAATERPSESLMDNNAPVAERKGSASNA